MVSPELAVDVAARMSCAVICVSSFEQLWLFERIYGRHGLFASSITRIVGSPAIVNLGGNFATKSALVLAAALSLIGAVTGPFSSLGAVAIGGTFILAVLNRLTRTMGGDGAEQMALLSLFAICIAVVPGANETTSVLAAYFIGAQLILCYFTAGVVKAVSPLWRSGNAFGLVMGSEAYGQPWAARFVESFPRLSRGINWAVVLVECLFPLILVAPAPVALSLLAAGFTFHAVSAIAMGLNTFLIAFPATYLCVLVVVQKTSPFW